MLELGSVSVESFLKHYWQKKPLVLRQAMPGFVAPLSPDELAGLAMEDEIESRIVCENNGYNLQRGPFTEKDFAKLPKTHWTLLVQGVDRFVPEVYQLLEHFDFIPQWRFDDVMISFAALHGGVGPHYDNYDVFLYQAQGRRKWLLTTQHCVEENYLPDLELRIMDQFVVEQEFILEEGDMLYLPPHVGHNGISLSDECMTYSFGYRAYPAMELLDSFGDYLATHDGGKELYRDPDWSGLKDNGVLTKEAWEEARGVLRGLLEDEEGFKRWFAGFATGLDRGAEEMLLDPVDEPLEVKGVITRNPWCRFVCVPTDQGILFFVNGEEWPAVEVPDALLILIASKRFIDSAALQPYLTNAAALEFINSLIREGFLQY